MSIRSALLARVHDTHVTVLDALYSKPDTLLPLVSNDPLGYIQTLADVLHSSTSSPSRNLIRSHLRFVAGHLYPRLATHDNAKELTPAVFQQIFFPYLLYSKSRQKTASMVWDLIKENGDGDNSLSRYELLRECAERAQQGDDDSLDALAVVNATVADRIAGTLIDYRDGQPTDDCLCLANMASSSSFTSHLAFILSKIQDSNAHAKAFAYLVGRGLLKQLSGERQIDVAHQFLDAMGLESLSGMEDLVRNAADLQPVGILFSTRISKFILIHLQFLSGLESAVVLKPSKRSTVNRLQLAILALLPDVSRPATGSLDWINPNAVSILVNN